MVMVIKSVVDIGHAVSVSLSCSARRIPDV